MDEVENKHSNKSFIDKFLGIFPIRAEIKKLNDELETITIKVLELSDENKQLKQNLFILTEKNKELFERLQVEKDKRE